ncbi:MULTISPECIES: transglycosylase family protein [Staphylococcus]|uniref:Transglycosylase SceD n=3 Tax=Staphylococcus TaxID=1279 RepID=A0AB34AL64_STAUR|nr:MULTISPECIES: transglycosylase family protein [Staphylococcus]AQM41034.1 transglycosylase [Staphylococcus cohnii]SCS95103.1 SceD-like transglycosylase, biomarker for vancomycin-intermediate strains [Staphylococcus cohnii subsp. cohnii]MBL0377106.1 transglycosylase family protein [Staphylococcus sp. S75]MBL0384847.1 transglycosylase family protein [Staphylococcus sp. S59]MBL0399917.1 transglycosylase family protein [Staphylococcus sp. S36]
MKKTVLASTLAVGLGVTGFAAGNSADAAEQGIDKAELANLAQSNPEQLNASPVQEGSYSYNFNYNGLNYNFESNGQTWSWSYGEGSSANASTVEQPQQAQTEQPAQQTAPQTEQTQQPQQEATTKASTQSSSSNEASSGSSVNVNSHLQAIAQRESGGDLKAVNPSSGAAGKYQFLQSTWDSVAPAQYKGVSPTEAPESVQDAAAVKLYNEVGASQWVTA